MTAVSTYVAVLALVLSYVALVAAYVALRTLARLRRSTAVLARTNRGSGGIHSLAEAIAHQGEQNAVLAEELAALRTHVDQQLAARDEAGAAAVAAAVASVSPPADEAGALRNVALVRYDAFADMSGRLSFSLALLDAAADGIVISAIAGRSETRVYAKGVAARRPVEGSAHELSPEEKQAVAAAMNERRVGLLGRKSA